MYHISYPFMIHMLTLRSFLADAIREVVMVIIPLPIYEAFNHITINRGSVIYRKLKSH